MNKKIIIIASFFLLAVLLNNVNALSTIEVAEGAGIVISNGDNIWSIDKDSGVLERWNNMGDEYVNSGGGWDWTSVTATQSASNWDDSSNNKWCYSNGNHTSFKSKIMTRIACLVNYTSVGNNVTSKREFTFYTNSNYTDLYHKMNTFTTSASSIQWNIGSQLTNISGYTSQCAGNTTNGTLDYNCNYLSDTYAGFWHNSSLTKGTVALMWHRNVSSENLNLGVLTVNQPSFIFSVGKNSSANSNIIGNASIFLRYAVTNMSSVSPSSNFNSIERENSRFNNSATIINRTGGCVNFYEHNYGGIAGSGDVFLCNASNNVLNVSITPNANTTRIWLMVNNFTSNRIFIYNSSLRMPTNGSELWAEISNESGKWVYSSVSGSNKGCSGSYNGTGIESDYVCNATGVWSYSPTNHMLLLTFDIHSDQNIRITDIALPVSTPTFLGNVTSVASSLQYLYSRNYGFQINWTDSDNNFANSTFQLGRPIGVYTNYTNLTVIGVKNISSYWYVNFTQSELGQAGNYNYTWYGIDIEGLTNKTAEINYIINKGNTSTRLWLNGTEGDKYYKNDTKANLTAQVNVSGLTINLKTNLTQEVNPTSGTTALENISTLRNTTNYVFNVTGYFLENANYTASEQKYFIFMDVVSPNVYSFNFNDTYITMNQSVKLSVNATDQDGVFNISTVIAEINTSRNRLNFTLSKESSGNYTYNFTKSDLGQFSVNATIINISRIYVNDSTNNIITNTSTLNFNYATTSLTEITDSPDPATNGSDQTFTVTAKWQTAENTNITAGCVVDFLDTNYTMTYSTNTGKYSVGISAAQPVAIYTYSVICTNSSYQSQANPDGSITITVGGSGGGPSGGSSGGSGTTLPSIVTNETIQMFPSQLSGLAFAGDSFIIKGIGADYSFRVKNIGKDDLFIIVDFFGDASQWVDLESVKIGSDVKQFTNYASTKEAIQIKPDMVASFNIRTNVPATTKDETYSFLTTFTDSRTGVFVSAESFVQVSRITSIFKYFTNFISWSYQKLTWKFGISKTGETIDNGFAFKGNVAFMIPFAGAMISIAVFYITFMLLTSGFIVPYAKKRIAGVNFNIGLAILLSIGITMLVLGFLP